MRPQHADRAGDRSPFDEIQFVKTSLLTPRMAGLLDRMRRAGRPALHTLTVAQARQFYEQGAEILDLPRAAVHRVEDVAIPTEGGDALAARLYVPSNRTLPVMVYFHGGGFTMGGLETHDSLCRQLALRSGVAVLAVNYRLAPEHRFPQAVLDAWAALGWVMAHAGQLGLDSQRVVVGGDSAGAALAAVSAVHARDQGWLLRGHLMITPHTAPEGNTASRRLFAEGFLLDDVTIEWFFRHYIDAHHRHDWRFAPLLADDLEGVAPACLVLAECDPLVDEGLAYADRLRSARVEVDLELVRGVTHDFIKMGRALPEALAAQQHVAEAVKRWCA